MTKALRNLFPKNPIHYPSAFKSLNIWAVSKWVFIIAAYLFLAYKLLNFHRYQELALQWRQMTLSQSWWLMGVLILLPLNLFLESVKWKMLTSKVQKISLITSIKAVLSGISTGFFTPNRVGELVGRVAFLDPGNRKSGITLNIVSGLTQSLVMVVCGVPACTLFLSTTTDKWKPDTTNFVLILITCILLVGLIYFTLPRWRKYFNESEWPGKIRSFTDCIYVYKLKDLLKIIRVSFIRYLVFCTQFYFMLRFFGIDLTAWHALIAIPTTYLFVTFTPTFAFSDVATRSSYAVLVIGAFSAQLVNIALAGVCIWAVNLIIPMMVGSVFMVRKRV